MIDIRSIDSLPDDKLKLMHKTLLAMLNQRQNTKHNKRTKKLKINFRESENTHFNNLMSAVKAELEKRKLNVS